jgi:DNA replication protein
MPLFDGFPKGTKALPVPSPFLGSLLADIDDVSELKCTLRFLWHAAQVAGAPKWVDEATLLADGVLATAIGAPDAIRRALDDAVARGTLAESGGRFLLATPENIRVAEAANAAAAPAVEPGLAPEPVMAQQTNIYALYEANIGLLTPIVADQLRDAEQTYPVEWIEAAIKEATERNARNWRYIATILERWTVDGPSPSGTDKDHQRTSKRGESGRHPQTASAAEYLRQRRTAR